MLDFHRSINGLYRVRQNMRIPTLLKRCRRTEVEIRNSRNAETRESWRLSKCRLSHLSWREIDCAAAKVRSGGFLHDRRPDLVTFSPRELANASGDTATIAFALYPSGQAFFRHISYQNPLIEIMDYTSPVVDVPHHSDHRYRLPRYCRPHVLGASRQISTRPL